MPNEREIEEIEAILYREVDASPHGCGITGVPEAAAAISAYFMKKRQDEARWQPTGRMFLPNMSPGEAQWHHSFSGAVQMFPMGFDPNTGTMTIHIRKEDRGLIEALRSKDREDEARDMRGRAAARCVEEADLWNGPHEYDRGFSNGCRESARLIEALPLTARTEDGDA